MEHGSVTRSTALIQCAASPERGGGPKGRRGHGSLVQRELSAQPTEGLFAQYATPFSLEENGVARQKNADGACAAAVVSASLSLAEQERREDGAR